MTGSMNAKSLRTDWKPPEPQYRGPAEWELKIAEDQVKSWQWHLEMRHDKFKRKIETDNKNATTRCTVHEIDIKNTDTPEERCVSIIALSRGRCDDAAARHEAAYTDTGNKAAQTALHQASEASHAGIEVA